jgi:S-disulfanyl-L-cysteine oxidoreductase SoxD
MVRPRLGTVTGATSLAMALVTALVALTTAAQQASTSTDQGAYSSAQAVRGGQVYAEHCARCHAEDLSGSDFGDGTPPLKRSDFMAGRTLRDVFDRIKRGMPFDAPASLTDQQYVDVVAYVLRENGHPQGPGELPVTPDILGNIVVAKRAPGR